MLRSHIRTAGGQVAMEFLVYIGVSLFLFSIILLASLSHLRDIREGQKTVAMQDFSYSVQYQLVVLSSLKDGTTLSITLPTRVSDKYEYTITAQNGYLFVHFGSDEISLPIPLTSGSFNKGKNSVTKSGGVLAIA